jgi:hypothetical protein
LKPKLIEGKWYIEVVTMELGNVLLLDFFTKLAIPIQFETENEAFEYIKTQKAKEGFLMGKEIINWCIVGKSQRPCANCGKETYNVSLSFECPMCSEECDNVKYREYEEALKKYY